MTTHSSLSVTIPFRRPKAALGEIDAAVAAGIVSAASDIALILDRDGIVRDRSVSSSDLASNGIGDWLDRAWIDTVTGESRHKISEMLADALAGKPSRWREVNHPADDGEVAVRYFALSAGEDGRIIVLGRDLQASAALQQRLIQVQQSVERDYLRLRQAELRYRLLFQSASEAVLILDASTRRIREANPAVTRITGRDEAQLLGQPFTALLDPASQTAAADLLAAATGTSAARSLVVGLSGGGSAALSASMFRHDRSSSLLVRLTPETVAVAEDPNATLNAVLSRISDAFVVTDTDLRILTANPAFLELTDLVSREEAINLPLDQFLGRPQIDVKIMLSQLREHGALRNFATVIRTRLGEQDDVEVTAVVVPDDTRPTYGFSIRNVARRMAPAASAPILGGAVSQSVEQLTHLIGRVPMKDIVRESTDLIEKLCIEAALTLTSDNRASAADVLGLSRQSLYSKLRRYGLGDLDD
ncbi:transcriptional regulator PpsR [Brevundimonas sp. R86498]|uniref:transcriptional regulator PpsR n=1 Tax=Brevundimonas sp. R86498 TaxID=3093845 RepID=UPI0037CAD380